jgi:3-methyladenine DNA glycosylase AlkD
MLGEREFFIRKAIGWVLREVSKKRPKLAYEFLREHRDEVSGLTLSEGAKYLPPAQRRALRLAEKAAWVLREKKRAKPRAGVV